MESCQTKALCVEKFVFSCVVAKETAADAVLMDVSASRPDESMLLEVSSSTEGATQSPSVQSSFANGESVASPEAVDALLGVHPPNGKAYSLADSVSALDMLDNTANETDVSRVYDSSAVGMSSIGPQSGIARALSFATSAAIEADSDVSSIYPAPAHSAGLNSQSRHLDLEHFSSFMSDSGQAVLAAAASPVQPSAEHFPQRATTGREESWDSMHPTPLDDSIDFPAFKTVAALLQPGFPTRYPAAQSVGSSTAGHDDERAAKQSAHAAQSQWDPPFFSPLQTSSTQHDIPPRTVALRSGGARRVLAAAPGALPARSKQGARRVKQAKSAQLDTHKENSKRRAHRRASRRATERSKPSSGPQLRAAAPVEDALPHAADFAERVLASSAVHDTPGRLSVGTAASRSSRGTKGSRASAKGKSTKRSRAKHHAKPPSCDVNRNHSLRDNVGHFPRSAAAPASSVPPMPPQPRRAIQGGSSRAHSGSTGALRPPMPPPGMSTASPGGISVNHALHGAQFRLPITHTHPPGPAAVHRQQAPRSDPPPPGPAAVHRQQAPRSELRPTHPPAAVVPSVTKSSRRSRSSRAANATAATKPTRAQKANKATTTHKAPPAKRHDPVARFHAMQAVWSNNALGSKVARRRRQTQGKVAAPSAGAGAADSTPWLR